VRASGERDREIKREKEREKERELEGNQGPAPFTDI